MIGAISPADDTVAVGAITISAEVTDNDGIAFCVVLIDDAEAGRLTEGPFNFVVDTTKLADGEHWFKIRAADKAGNTTESSRRKIKVKNNEPAITIDITAPADGATVSGQVQITAHTTANRAGIMYVEFYANGQLIQHLDPASADQSITWDARDLSGNFTITAKASDYLDNTAEDSITVTVAASPDDECPTVGIREPFNGTLLGKTFRIWAEAHDNRGVTKVRYYLVDGFVQEECFPAGTRTDLFASNFIGESSTPLGYEINWDSRGATDGDHTIVAEAEDAAGNVKRSFGDQISLDNTAPVVGLSEPRDGQTVSGIVTVRAIASDLHLSQAYVYADDHLIMGLSNGVEGTVAWDTRNVQNGDHFISAVARDSVGNETSVTVRVVVDNGVPEPELSIDLAAPIEGATLWGDINVRWVTTGNNIVSVVFIVSGQVVRTWTPATAPNGTGLDPWGNWVDSGLPSQLTWDSDAEYPSNLAPVWPNNNYTVTVRVTDAAGRTAEDSAHITTANPDPPTPVVTIISPVDGGNAVADPYSGLVNFFYTVDSPYLVTSKALFADGVPANFGPDGVSWDAKGAAPGVHTLTIRVYDRRGGFTSDSATFTLVADTTKPVLFFDNLFDGEEICSTFRANLHATDDRAVARIELWHGSRLIGSQDGAFASFLLDTRTLPADMVELRGVAVDHAGNTISQIVRPIVRRWCDYRGDIRMELRLPMPKAVGRVILAARHTDGPAPETADLYVDGRKVVAWVGPGPEYTVAWDSTGVEDGLHEVVVYANRADGKYGWAKGLMFVNNPGGLYAMGARLGAAGDVYLDPHFSAATPAEIAAIDWNIAAANITFFVSAEDAGLIGVSMDENGNGNERTLGAAFASFEITPADAAGAVPFFASLAALGINGSIQPGDITLIDGAGNPVALSRADGGAAISALLPGPGAYTLRDNRLAGASPVVPLVVKVGASPSAHPLLRVESNADVRFHIFNAAGELVAEHRQASGPIEGGTGVVYAVDLPSDAYFVRIDDAHGQKTSAKILVVR